MLDAGLDEEELAAEVGIHPEKLVAYMTGRQPMPAGLLYELAVAVRRPVGDFFVGLFDSKSR